MKYTTLGLDIETTAIPVFHPWQDGAYIISVGLCNELGWRKTWTFNHDEERLFSVDSDKGKVHYKNQREMIDDIQWYVDKCKRLVGHNIKFDLNWLRSIGVRFDHCKLWCTKLVEYLLRGQRLGQLSLKDLSIQRLTVNKIDRVAIFWKAGYETSEIPLSILLPYLEQDCINTLAIYQQQVTEVIAEGMLPLVSIQNEVTRSLSEIECNGMRLDKNVAAKHVKQLTLQLAAIDAELLLLFDFDCNFKSKDELSAGLYGGTVKRKRKEWYTYEYKGKPETAYKCRTVVDEVKVKGLGFKVNEDMETKKKGVYKTDKGTIQFLKSATKEQREAKRLLVERSKAAKALVTLYGDDNSGIMNKVQSDGLIHPQYNQTVAKTGRLTSSDPNGQNLPREGTSPVKESIVARFNKILCVDLSQIEWRVAAWLSQDPVMMDEILHGVDIHTVNAVSIFGADPKGDAKKFKELRTIAKIVTFRLLYGGTHLGFYYDNQMPMWSKKKWQEVVDNFWSKYRGLARWHAHNMNQVIKDKGLLRIPTGRKFVLRKNSKKGGYKLPQVANFPVQGMATADIMPLAMCIIYKEYLRLKEKGELNSLIIGQVHDSLIFDTVDGEEQVITKMCLGVFRKLPEYMRQVWGIDFNVALGGDAEIGSSWGQMEPLKEAA